MAFPRQSGRKKDEPLTPEALEEAALKYLNRFDCSVEKLRSHLGALIRRRGGDAALFEHVGALLERYRASGLLDDTRFAEGLANRLRERGKSRKMVVQKLRARGISRDTAETIVRSAPNADLESARAFVRRRRLGPHRPEAERAPNRRRDLAVLARAGFDHDTAVRALGHGSDEDF